MLTPCDIDRLAKLSNSQQALYCLALLQRMSPNYLLFCQAVELDHQADFNKLMALFWEKTLFPQNKINFAIQRERFEDLIPDPQQYDMYGVYPALDCCVVAECLFTSLLEPTGQEAEQASQTSLASVLGMLELQYGELTDEQVMQQELVQHELEFQTTLLDAIDSLAADKNGIQALKALAVNQGVSNLGICLDAS
ncbi:YjaG family protein [Agarivorans sp. TSD2052]|uniref:YjaG family protein n=1 Tax=Agarivorans sp. TSD2052 TaxID=2937286 RepID=UPI00200C2BBD|nr:YjaG family protein [Agarivorans sp. TSD2052]UPW18151.1 YjaG family protein [Agarivorans sp. TSD2052]